MESRFFCCDEKPRSIGRHQEFSAFWKESLDVLGRKSGPADAIQAKLRDGVDPKETRESTPAAQIWPGTTASGKKGRFPFVVSLDDDGWPSRSSPPLSTGYTAFTVDARGRGPMCICRNDHMLKQNPNGAAPLADTWPGRRHGIYMKAGCSVLGDPVVGYGCFE